MEFITHSRSLIFFGCLYGFLGVTLGAFGSHLLKNRLSLEMLQIYEIGVRYQMYHALALVGAGIMRVLDLFSPQLIQWSGYAFMLGILIFSGSLYLLALTGVKTWGAVTPVGGFFLMVGWLLLMISLNP